MFRKFEHTVISRIEEYTEYFCSVRETRSQTAHRADAPDTCVGLQEADGILEPQDVVLEEGSNKKRAHVDDSKADEGKRPVKKKRSPRRTEADRRADLERDEYIARVEPHLVVCRACEKSIGLNKKSTYDGANWRTHKSKCPQIIGVFVVRGGAIKAPRAPVSVGIGMR